MGKEGQGGRSVGSGEGLSIWIRPDDSEGGFLEAVGPLGRERLGLHWRLEALEDLAILGGGRP